MDQKNSLFKYRVEYHFRFDIPDKGARKYQKILRCIYSICKYLITAVWVATEFIHTDTSLKSTVGSHHDIFSPLQKLELLTFSVFKGLSRKTNIFFRFGRKLRAKRYFWVKYLKDFARIGGP